MKTVRITACSTKISLENAWNLITDIEKYPQRVKYVKKVKVYGRGVGAFWEDITSILWIPIKIQHTITAYKKNKEYSFTIPLSFGGRMTQKYMLLKENPKKIIVKGLITYDLGSKILNDTIGTILKPRLKKMLISSLQGVGAEIIN